MQTIIWDWNGTLLNDLDFCIATINSLLGKRKLPLLDRNSYKANFTFPVKDYYAAIGFDFKKEAFEIPAREFIDKYDLGVKTCDLHKDAVEILTHFKKQNTRQFVLSAMKQNMLEQTLKQNSIFDFFEGVYGLDNHYAVSKIDRGKQLIAEFQINKDKTIIVGDTVHDFEVAKNLGIKCILVADGHQAEDRLKNSDATVIDELKQLLQVKL